MKLLTLCLAPVTLAACLTQEPGSDDPAPADFEDAKGNVWRMRGPAKFAPPERSTPRDLAKVEPRTDANGLPSSDAERAASLRPVAFFNGNEYELVATDDELLARYQALAAAGPMGGAPGRPQVQVAHPSGPLARIFPNDDRVPLGHDAVNYPNSAVGAIESMKDPPYFTSNLGCTMTMIGPSTAISAAHCFYDPGIGWQYPKGWSFGLTSWLETGWNGFTIDVEQAYPTYHGCYWVTVPGAWTTLQPQDNWNDSFYDFAVIEFSNSQAPTCNLYPGNTVGWYGWWTASDAQIQRSKPHINGYPGEIPRDYAMRFAWPTQFTQEDYVGSVYSTPYEAFLIFTHMDVTPGQSGSAIAQELFAPGDRYVTAVVNGAASTANWGRRIDATVRNFVLQYSAL